MYHCLWEYENLHYKYSIAKDDAWRQIEKCIAITRHTAKKAEEKVRILRNTYRKKQ